MFDLTKVFQASVCGLLCLSSVMFALAEGSPLPQGLTLPLVIFAFINVERRKSFALPLAAANVMAFIAFGLAFAEFFGILAMKFGPFSLFSPNTVEARLLSVAHLIVYFSWIVVLLERQVWHYWVLCALSVLQVAVASVLTNDALFGLLLILFLGTAVWTLAVFTLYQAERRFDRRGDTAADDDLDDQAARDRARGGASDLAALRKPSLSHGTIQHDLHDQWINRRFVLGVGAMCFGSLIIAAGFYLFIPRVWIGQTAYGAQNSPLNQNVQPLTGFTEEVSLGDMGQILESSERVLAMRMVDLRTEKPMDVLQYATETGFDEPYFRGKTLDVYADGRWTSIESSPEYVPPKVREATVRQEINLQPIGTRVLFGVFPVLGGDMTDDSLIERDRGDTMYAPLATRASAKSYRLLSPPSEVAKGPRVGRRPRPEHDELPREELPRLVELAQQVAGGESGQAFEPKAAAERLTNYLRNPAEFAYTLDVSITDPTIDPVEDFLFNRKQGHCEYYASALALMMRAVGIPARVISGFKGGDVDPGSGEFIVEQRHAHAWVEAYIGKTWETYDATPSNERAAIVQQHAGRGGFFARLATMGRTFWYGSMVAVSLDQQQSNLYGPLRNAMRDLADVWNSEGSDRARAIREFLSSPRRWFSLEGGIIAFVLLLVAALTAWLARRLTRLLRGTHWTRANRRRRSSVEFYERFQKLCRREGLVRPPAETQQEFADTVVAHLESRLASSGLGPFPRRLVQAYYRVRFGDQRLDEPEYDALNQQLASFEQALAARPAPATAAARGMA